MARILKIIMKKTQIKNKSIKMRKQLLILSALFISMAVFAQKSELKTADKAVKANDFAAAIAALDQAESLIANADQKTTAKYYYLRGKALYQNGSASADILKVGDAFNQLIDYEKQDLLVHNTTPSSLRSVHLIASEKVARLQSEKPHYLSVSQRPCFLLVFPCQSPPQLQKFVQCLLFLHSIIWNLRYS